MLIKFNKNSVSDFSFRFARSETVELAMCERIRGAIYTTLSAEIKIWIKIILYRHLIAV
jgi:hypothetical protein